jgi:hypothetical protein
MIIIGIDPGKNTGMAWWHVEDQEFVLHDTLLIHQALRMVDGIKKRVDVFVRVEDARKWKTHGKHVFGKDQGAGSIKRDCTIWEDMLKDLGIPYEMVNLQASLKKLSPATFAGITGITERTSEHARDACMLVYQFKPRKI